ncbi:MAG: COG1361 S-layer family protein [Eubacterium sp.]
MRILKKIMEILLVITLSFQMICYAVLADDKAADGGAADNIQPAFEPKVMIESYTFPTKKIYAGDEVTVDITLVNTSRTAAVKNMMVTAGIENEFMELTRTTDSIYIPQINAGGKYVVSYSFKTKVATPPGQYDLSLAMEYADKDGTSYSANGKVKVNVAQKAKIKFDPLIISPEAEIGDTIEAQVNAMNLGRGKVYNVRAKIKADGLTPKGTIYIGDIEAGEMGTGSVQVLVGGMTQSDESYGMTNGTVTFYYENESGKKSKIKKNFSVDIKELSVSEENVKEDDTNQWWIAMAVIIGIVCVFAGYGTILVIKKKNGEKHEMAA